MGLACLFIRAVALQAESPGVQNSPEGTCIHRRQPKREGRNPMARPPELAAPLRASRSLRRQRPGQRKTVVCFHCRKKMEFDNAGNYGSTLVPEIALWLAILAMITPRARD